MGFAITGNIVQTMDGSMGMEEKEEATVRSSMPGAKILVVDDMRVNLQIMLGLLTHYGLQVDTAASGREAVEKAEAGQYDLIFMDHMMPEMDGIEASAIIHKIEGYTNTPIIALTANDMQGMKEFYLENGFQDYLSKPINPETLYKVLDELMGKEMNYDQKFAKN
jgi:CheY-like chemotaxis protein